MSTIEVTPTSCVRLHPLAVRIDGDEIIVGRIETGDFIAIPHTGARVVDLLAQGMSVQEANDTVEIETGEYFDLVDFIESLIELGFVAEVDGRPVTGPPVVRSSLPWLRPEHVHWMLSPVVQGVVAAVVLAALISALVSGGPFPSYDNLLWSSHGGVVLLGQILMTWFIISLHELAHLATARAAGAPGRIQFSTRLQFLVVQTDISGILAFSRRYRLTAYCAGMVCDMLIGAIATIIAVADSRGVIHQIAAAAMTTVAVFLSLQLLIFMRTDVYLIFQEITRCRNLYTDGLNYLKYVILKTRRVFVFRSAPPCTDPSVELPGHERRIVRAYAILLAIGTSICLAIGATVTLPYEIRLIGNAIRELGSGSMKELLDGIIVLVVLGATQALWVISWWRRHGTRLSGRRSQVEK